MNKILLVDDKRVFHWLWQLGIANQFTFLHAYTIGQARELFDAHPDIAAVVVDAHMDGPIGIGLHNPPREWGFNTRSLVQELSQRFRGPIIASPSQWWHFKLMRSAGCTHYSWKWGVAALLKKLLANS
jgi:hypothetical protein